MTQAAIWEHSQAVRAYNANLVALTTWNRTGCIPRAWDFSLDTLMNSGK